jgi:hypothetical protein
MWLPDASLKARKEGTVYAIIRLKYLGKETFDELAQEQLKRDGWTAVEGKVATSFPAGEKWEWKAYKKGIRAGDVMRQLEHLSWDTKTGVLFLVKRRWENSGVPPPPAVGSWTVGAVPNQPSQQTGPIR